MSHEEKVFSGLGLAYWHVYEHPLKFVKGGLRYEVGYSGRDGRKGKDISGRFERVYKY